jgi:hypothetical protein
MRCTGLGTDTRGADPGARVTPTSGPPRARTCPQGYSVFQAQVVP